MNETQTAGYFEEKYIRDLMRKSGRPLRADDEIDESDLGTQVEAMRLAIGLWARTAPFGPRSVVYQRMVPSNNGGFEELSVRASLSNQSHVEFLGTVWNSLSLNRQSEEHLSALVLDVMTRQLSREI